jgi:hypothetical protein
LEQAAGRGYGLSYRSQGADLEPKNMTTKSECIIESDGRDLFVIFNGVKIAKRGQPDTPQAGQWVSLEPGYTVYGGTGDELVIERNGVVLQ